MAWAGNVAALAGRGAIDHGDELAAFGVDKAFVGGDPGPGRLPANRL